MKTSHAVTVARLIQAAERYAANSPPSRRLVLYDAIAEARRLPDPDCFYCSGTGERYWHSEDCQNDNCTLAGGYDDCAGQVVPCECSIMDVLEEK